MMILKTRPQRHTLVALCGAALFNLAACKDKPKPAEPEQAAAEEAAEAVASSPAVELDPGAYNAKRTQAFGFLARVPASAEGAIGVRDLSSLISGLLDSNTFKRGMALAGELSGQPVEMQQLQMVQAMVDQYVGKELFAIFAEGSGAQFERIQLVSEMLSEINMRAAGAAIAQGGGDVSNSMLAMQMRIKADLADSQSELSQALEKFQFPPMIIGTKVSDGAAEAVAWLEELEAQLPPIVTIDKVEAGGGKFTAWKLNLQDVVDEGAKANLNEFLQDEAATDRIAEIIRKKTVEFCFGVIDNYLVFSLGSDHSHLNFVSKPEESLLAAKAFGFTDQFLDKKIISYSYMSKAMLAPATQAGQIQRMADAFDQGLAGSGAAIKKLGGLVKKLAGHAEKLAKRGSQTYVGLSYADNGIRGESIGGYTTDMVDSRSVSQFANAAPADAAMVISSVANPAYRGESIAMMETLFGGVEIGVEAWSESSGDSSSLEQFKQMKELLGDNLGKVWGILKGDFLEGIGSQNAIIVDLKGGMPKGIPGLPNVLENEGKVPRIALAADVADRAKLAAAWGALVPEINAALLKVPGQEPGSEVQVPDVITDEAGELATHYFPLPFSSNDFLPSLSLNDEVIFLATSKQFAQGLATAANSGAGDIRGTYMMMNFAECHRFAESWLKLASENAAQLFPGEAQAQEFQRVAPQIQQALELTRGIRSLKFNRFEDESGAMRSSWHLHLEDIGAAGE